MLVGFILSRSNVVANFTTTWSRVEGLGCGVKGVGFKVEGEGFGAQDLGSRV